MARVSAGLGKFNKIEQAIRDSMLALDRAEKEIDHTLTGKRTAREQVEFNKLKENLATEKKNVKSLWESMWELAGD